MSNNWRCYHDALEGMVPRSLIKEMLDLMGVAGNMAWSGAFHRNSSLRRLYIGR